MCLHALSSWWNRSRAPPELYFRGDCCRDRCVGQHSSFSYHSTYERYRSSLSTLGVSSTLTAVVTKLFGYKKDSASFSAPISSIVKSTTRKKITECTASSLWVAITASRIQSPVLQRGCSSVIIANLKGTNSDSMRQHRYMCSKNEKADGRGAARIAKDRLPALCPLCPDKIFTASSLRSHRFLKYPRESVEYTQNLQKKDH